ncbi:MAG: hypothetical protein V3V99_04685 [candidate division Zixibacteria bacterium]
MKIAKLIFFCIIALGISGTAVVADVSRDKAIEIGKEDIRKLTDQSYHYRVDYDTIIILPVHSKSMRRDNFYLLYFLKDGFFQAEIEVNKKTGKTALLSIEKMSPPYYEMHNGKFSYHHYDPDSVIVKVKKRHSITTDSLRLVYFGIIPKFGKRGVVWEIYSARGTHYQIPGAGMVTRQNIIRDLNQSQWFPGNHAADEIRYKELMEEIERINNLTEDDRNELNLTPEKLQEYIDTLEGEKKDILLRFSALRKLEKDWNKK